MKTLLIAGVVGFFASVAPAQDQAPPDAAAMMEAYAQATQPGAHHKKLEPFVGEWRTTTRAWVAPGAEPMVTEGKARKSWDLDGRFIREELAGESVVGPYRGVGYLGFDNASKQYQGVWLSSMSTGMITYSGTMSDDGKTLTAHGTEGDPISGGTLEFEMTLTIDSPDQHTLAFWYLIEGEKMKAFEIVHERQN